MRSPGARGCTPEACSFRDERARFAERGARILGLSTQDTEYQREAVERLHLPYPILSDERLELTRALRLPTFETDGLTLIRRTTLIVRDGVIADVVYPVFPPDRRRAGVVPLVRDPMGRAARMGRVDVAEVSRLLPARRASDAALVRSAQRGSERAVEELFARHWPDAYRTALLIAHDRAAAEDIAQEAFVAALRALPRFDRSRPLRPWLHRIVVNRAIDWARARRLRREVDGGPCPRLRRRR